MNSEKTLIDKTELRSRLWSERVSGLKTLGNSLVKEHFDLMTSACALVLGDENFIQRAVIFVQRKFYISKFKDYHSQVGAYEQSVVALLEDVNLVLLDERKIRYTSTIDSIEIDEDDRFENATWGDNAISAYTKLVDYVNHIMDVLDKAEKELEKE